MTGLPKNPTVGRRRTSAVDRNNTDETRDRYETEHVWALSLKFIPNIAPAVCTAASADGADRQVRRDI